MQTPIDKTNPVEMALLRLGAFELKYSLEIPYAVIIDEYVSIASEFGATKGDRFINGVLDALSKQTRPLETQGQVLKQNIQPKPKSIQTNTPRKSRI
jgi:N utilization substance protein B